MIVFSSDNGTTHEGPPGTRFHIGGVDPAFFNSTAGLRGFKGSVYEGGIRVPMICRLPGVIESNKENDTPSYFADWFPTLCEATGIEKPADLDGESLWQVLTNGEKLVRRKPMLWVFPEYGGQVAILFGDMKIVRQNLRTKKPSAWEVYDLKTDRAEAHNVASSSAELIHEAEEQLRREVAQNAFFPLSIPGVNTDLH